MSDFLMIVPEGWTEVVSLAAYLAQDGNLGEMQFWVQQEAWIDIENMLVGTGEVPDGKHILSARLVYLNDGVHLWVLLG